MSEQDRPGMGGGRGHADRRRGLRFIPALGALTVVGLSLYASQSLPQAAKEINPPVQAQGEDKAVKAANAFLQSLDEKDRAKALYEYDSKKKSGWSNLPVSAVPRNGVRMGDLNKAQHAAAMDLLTAVLSKEGYQKTLDIMEGDEQLAKGGGKGGKDKGGKDKGDKGKGGKGGGGFGKDNYYLAIFGKPAVDQPWMVQFGGHHLGLNITVAQKSFVLTPTHTGAQPTSFMIDGKTVRPLGAEVDKGFKLMASLDDKQKALAIISGKAGNLVLGPGQDGKTIKAEGIKGSALSDAQQAMLLDVIGEWVNIVPGDSAAARMAEIKKEIGDTYFAWSGPTAPGSAAYFRVTGPTVVIEYAPQGGTDHIHTIIRDPSNDYGQKLTKK